MTFSHSFFFGLTQLSYGRMLNKGVKLSGQGCGRLEEILVPAKKASVVLSGGQCGYT